MNEPPEDGMYTENTGDGNSPGAAAALLALLHWANTLPDCLLQGYLEEA